MVCPNCQSNISEKRTRCDRCGHDLILQKKIFMASNMYYNNGLARARVRDLSGGIAALNNSLELNKANTSARNLLGLIYFEMGEIVAALSEWVISKHFMPDDNDADRYINAVQQNPTKLEGYNQAIKRYNNALTFAKQKSDDLAIIQLKRVLSLNPNFIRAYHLLSLLYIKNGEKEKARKCLLRASSIDVSSTTTLRYLKELDPQQRVEGGEGETTKNNGSLIVPVSTYREDKPNIMAFVNLVIGVLVGLAVSAFLIIPSIKDNNTTDNNQKYIDYSAGMATLQEKEAALATLQEEKSGLVQTINELKAELDNIVIPENNPQLYDTLFMASSLYMDEISKAEADREFTEIARLLSSIDISQYESEDSLKLLDRLKQETYPSASAAIYKDGHNLYSDNKYEEALEVFFESYKYDPTNVDTIYFIGRTYDRLEDYVNARSFYEIVINDYSDTRRYQNAKSYNDKIQD